MRAAGDIQETIAAENRFLFTTPEAERNNKVLK
jgi:hypothetical protein